MTILTCPSCKSTITTVVREDRDGIPRNTCPMCNNTRLGRKYEIDYSVSQPSMLISNTRPTMS